MNGLSSTAFAKQTNFAQAIPPRSRVRSAASLINRPMRAIASMLIPARVVAALTEPHKRSVDDNASGIESRNSLSFRVNPLCTSAEYPPMKSTPTVPAASSIARPMMIGLPCELSARIETGVTAIRLLAMRMPISSPISLTVLTSRAAESSIFFRTRCAVVSTETDTQARSLKPRVTVRMSRCSISVMRTVCRISAWVYSIRLATKAQRQRDISRRLTRIYADEDTQINKQMGMQQFISASIGVPARPIQDFLRALCVSVADFFLRLAHYFAEHEQNHEQNKQSQRYQDEAQTGIVMSFFEHHRRHVMDLFYLLHGTFDGSARGR